jgi:REP element-mobilizing transposase RayT
MPPGVSQRWYDSAVPHPERGKRRLPLEVYAQPGTVGLLTICTQSRRSVFSEDGPCHTLVSVLGSLHGDRWQILAYVIMPDHVHVVVANRKSSLVEFVRLAKGRSSASIRKEHGISALWQTSFHDHLLRETEDLGHVIEYMLNNPVRARLTSSWAEYRWSGSFRWPNLADGFSERRPTEVLWREALADE